MRYSFSPPFSVLSLIYFVSSASANLVTPVSSTAGRRAPNKLATSATSVTFSLSLPSLGLPLCVQNCHQKPKFAGHDFCSKKCGSASQAASSANANASVPNTSKPNASTGQAAHKGIPSSNGGVVPPTVPAPQCQQAQGIDLTELASKFRAARKFKLSIAYTRLTENILQQLQPSSGAPLPQQISQIVAGLLSAQQPINNGKPRSSHLAPSSTMTSNPHQVPHSNNPYGYSVPSSHVPVQVDAQGFPIDPNFM